VEQLVILSKLEQEYLLRVIEAAVRVRDLRQFFLWAQGQVQALLPHRVLVCMQFGPADELLRLECLHGAVLDESALRLLSDPASGLALRAARICRDGVRMPCMTGAGHDGKGALAPFQQELEHSGFDNLLLHGSGRLAGGSSVFALLGLPMKPGPRHAYFLELLLPYLHLALLRLSQAAAAETVLAPGAPVGRTLSARETEILGWVREGKSNYEIGCILGISGLTVKNHLQRIYKALGVSNRTHALARCLALRLLEPLPEPAPP
jgi:transcriptional regulator EpsA